MRWVPLSVGLAVMGAVAGGVGAAASGESAGAAPRVLLGPADFEPVLAPAPGQSRIHVAAFNLDRRPVTNGEFLQFVRNHPEWQRGRVPGLFADSDYLSHWAEPVMPGEGAPADQPVTRVSWFAARAYCAATGGRLPSWYEWELVSSEDGSVAGGAVANGALAVVRLGRARAQGLRLRGAEGPTWEWVEDYSSLLVSGDSRDQGDPDKLAYCGAGALSAQDRQNYPVLMHIAFLSAVEARSTARSLGFRCAADAQTALAAGGTPKPDVVPPPHDITAPRDAPAAHDSPATHDALAAHDLPADSLFHLDLPLETASGTQVQLASLRGQPLLITMFYSHCTNVCPMTTNLLLQIERQLAPQMRAKVRVLMVSFDATGDPPSALDAFVKMHGIDKSRWIVARPRADDVRTLAAVLGIRYRELPDHSFNHSTVIVLADRAGVVKARQVGAKGIDPGFVAAVRSIAADRVAIRQDGGSSRRRQ